MLSMILSWTDAHPRVKVLGTIVVCLAVSFYILQELLKPVGKRRGPGGKRYNLPPGPKGVPILGSLPFLKDRARDEDHKAVS